MKKLVLVTSALILLAAVAAPAATARHAGPCLHEYVEIGLYVVKGGSVKDAATYVGYCVNGTLRWVCHGCLSEGIERVLP